MAARLWSARKNAVGNAKRGESSWTGETDTLRATLTICRVTRQLSRASPIDVIADSTSSSSSSEHAVAAAERTLT